MVLYKANIIVCSLDNCLEIYTMLSKMITHVNNKISFYFI